MRIDRMAWAALAVCFGCSATGNGSDTSAGGGGAGSTGSGTGGLGFTTSSGTGVGGSSGCSAAAELVYVLSTANDLYSFEPQNKLFKKIGPLGCATSMQPNSMAVDRDAVAWVNYVQNDGLSDTAGTIFKVSTNDASCQPTSIALGPGWYRLGMGFSSDSEGGSTETLFVAGTGDAGLGNSPGLAKIDLGTQKLQPIGPFGSPLTGQSAELTGTGDARLYGFFTTTPVEVAHIDKASAAILDTKSFPQVMTPAAWAFSFWGGDFYLYTAPDPNLYPGVTSNVTRYDPVTSAVDPAYMTSIGFVIVGAGVSTCAPLVQPN